MQGTSVLSRSQAAFFPIQTEQHKRRLVEFDKHFDSGDSIKWGVFYIPTIYNSKRGTAQAYYSLCGIFSNSATLWAGQRYHRIQGVHIVDNWLMEDGDNYGTGIDDIPLGGLGRINVAVHTADTFSRRWWNARW